MSHPSLMHEIKQSKPFPSAAQEAVLALLRTADVVRQRLGGAIEPFGVTPQQYNVLRILRGAGKEGLPTLEIVERMIERAPGITRLVDHLEERGLLERQRCAQDRRIVYCRITPAGLALLASMDRPANAADEAVIGGLSPRELDKLLKLLAKVRGACTGTAAQED